MHNLLWIKKEVQLLVVQNLRDPNLQKVVQRKSSQDIQLKEIQRKT